MAGTHGSRKYQCTICSRSFGRKDILYRHMQIHDESRPPPISRKKSCAACIKSKIKCQAGQPSCSACLRKGLPCIYEPPLRKRRANDTPGADALNQQPEQQALQEGSTLTIHYGHQLSPGGYETTAYHSLNPGSDGSQPFGQQLHESYNDFPAMMLDPVQLDDFNISSESNLGWIFGDFPESFTGLVESGDSAGTTISDTTKLNLPLAQDSHHNLAHEEMLSPLPTPIPQDRCHPNDPWPMEWHSTPAPRLVLPKLGAPGEEILARHYPTDRIDAALSTMMQEILRLPMERSPWQAVLVDFPDHAKLDHCIDMYWVHFQRILPIVRRPTFDPAKSPLVALAMACIGACYTAFEGAKAFADALSEFNRRLLVFMAETDPRFARTEAYVTAQLLQGTHGYCSGSKRLFECSEGWRSSLVHNTKCMGLFRERAPMAQKGGNLTERWHAWVAQEKLRRLAWAVYEYDSSSSYLHNLRPYISVAEVRMSLPSSQAHWEAESPQAWASLHPWTDRPRPLAFRDAIRTFFDGAEPRPVDKLTDERHRHIIILTLMRMLWTLKEIKRSPICDLVDTDDHQGRDQRNLLKVVDKFQRVSIVKESPRGTVDMDVVRRYQLVHLAHFFAAGDLMNWLYPLLRGGTEATRAREPMGKWADASASRVRELAYHSAQVLAVIRNYPCNLPLEAFNAFHAGVVLCCMASLLPEDSQPQAGRPILTLDKLAEREGQEALNQDAIDAWILEGGSQIVGVFGVPVLASRVGKWQVLEQTADILRGMRVWGIAQNFLNVITELLGTHRDEHT
ncbi:hypothetical protein H2200_010809 [Cladophialophora chaetospira]|uniref:C2H2 type zinc finger domain protein n=1 Tax=Cladophialophora chaetospira TaxID=386627 RepID=A0AA38X0T1_9EURO|nr:hypothetical protein H2200_010809 [Cladophialophora chaetospira]